MPKIRLLPVVISCFIFNIHAFAAEDTHARQVSNNTAKAGSQGSGSAGRSIAVSGQATSAAFATPLSMGGVAVVSGGAASIGVANESMRITKMPIGKPLRITDEAITITSPHEALKKQDEKQSERKD